MEIIVFLSIVIAVVAVLTSIVLVRRVKKQIAEMTDVLVDVKNGNGNRRILSATNELTAPLAYEINEIVVAYESRLSTVRQTEETNRQLMTSLSHDVRTPLIVIDPESEYRPLIEGLGGQVINISATSPNHINAMDMEQGYGDGENPVVLKSEFLLSLCEQLIGAGKLSAKEKSVIDRCTAQVYRDYIRSGYHGAVPTLQDFHAELLRQPEKEAQDVALAIELFTDGSLNTFAKPTNVDTNARILCYDIRDLGKQLLPVGMLVVLDSIFNRIIRNRGLKRNTWIYIDEIYLLFQHEYSANFLFTLWKRMRKYQACGTGISQNIEDLLQSHTARTMLANSEFLIMLNQAATDREELAHLLNISDNQLSYITNVDSGRGLIKCGSAIVPFVDHFPKNKLYRLMTTKPSDLAA